LGILGELLRKIKWSPPDRSKILLCPRCESPNIELSSKFDSWLMPKRYICRDCGYTGPIILEVDEKEERKGKDPG